MKNIQCSLTGCLEEAVHEVHGAGSQEGSLYSCSEHLSYFTEEVFLESYQKVLDQRIPTDADDLDATFCSCGRISTHIIYSKSNRNIKSHVCCRHIKTAATKISKNHGRKIGIRRQSFIKEAIKNSKECDYCD